MAYRPQSAGNLNYFQQAAPQQFYAPQQHKAPKASKAKSAGKNVAYAPQYPVQQRVGGIGRGYSSNPAARTAPGMGNPNGGRSQKQINATMELVRSNRAANFAPSLCGRALSGVETPETVQRQIAERRISDQICRQYPRLWNRYQQPGAFNSINQAAQSNFGGRAQFATTKPRAPRSAKYGYAQPQYPQQQYAAPVGNYRNVAASQMGRPF